MARSLNFVNGSFVAAQDGEFLPVYNPATNEIVGEIPRSKEADVNAGTAVGVVCSRPVRGSASHCVDAPRSRRRRQGRV
jgi:hypothetical protein